MEITEWLRGPHWKRSNGGLDEGGHMDTLPLGCQVLRSSQGSRLRQSALRKRPESSGKIFVVFAEGRKKGPLSP